LNEELGSRKPETLDLLDLIKIVPYPEVTMQMPGSLVLDGAKEIEREVRRQGLPL
jgi:hypothetical protein